MRDSTEHDSYSWQPDDIVLEARNMVAIRRVDEKRIAIREHIWLAEDAEIVIGLEDLPRVIERLQVLHAEWVAQQEKEETTLLPAGVQESSADELEGR